VQQLREKYIQALAVWNRVHRIVGAKDRSIEQLVRESEESLRGLRSPLPRTLLDVGAGSGILGIPWLWIGPAQSRTGLIEPDLKKSSFLIHFRSTLEDGLKERILVIPNKLQDVPRETVDRFAEAGDRLFVARAFSGQVDLTEAINASSFSSECFLSFCERKQGNSNSFVLEPVTISKGSHA